MADLTIHKQGAIATVTFDRGRKANPLSIGLMRELTKAAGKLAEESDLSAVVLTGRSDNFS